jgi:hypothetical protein
MAAKVKNVCFASEYADYWERQPMDADANVVNAGAAVVGANRLLLSWTRLVPSGLREDRAVFGIWLAKIVGGGLYSKLTLAELAPREAAVDTFVGALNLMQHSDWRCVEYAWFQVDENSPRDESGRSQLMGPAVRVVTKSLVGATGGNVIPHQVSSTITLRTASRRHWGRSYIGGFDTGRLTAQFGRWTTSTVDGLANAMNTLHDTWQDAGYQMGTYSLLKPAFLTPKQIEVDDVPDIVRRRRAKQTNYRKLLS